jgi:hypothetical protein
MPSRNTERAKYRKKTTEQEKAANHFSSLVHFLLYFSLSVFLLGIFSAFLMVDGEVLWHNLMM